MTGPTLSETASVHDNNWRAGRKKTDKGEKVKNNRGEGGRPAQVTFALCSFDLPTAQPEVTWVYAGYRNLG